MEVQLGFDIGDEMADWGCCRVEERRLGWDGGYGTVNECGVTGSTVKERFATVAPWLVASPKKTGLLLGLSDWSIL